MASQPFAKPPEPLSLEDRMCQGDNWKQFKRDRTYYEIAAKINKEDGTVRVAHLLNVIGTEGQDTFKTFNLKEMDHNYMKGSTRIQNKVCPCHKCYI